MIPDASTPRNKPKTQMTIKLMKIQRTVVNSKFPRMMVSITRLSPMNPATAKEYNITLRTVIAPKVNAIIDACKFVRKAAEPKRQFFHNSQHVKF